ncbi:MAG: LptA/OstA family protein, partial [Pseudolabrys sp.]
SSAQIGALSSTEIQAFTTTQANALTSTQLGSLTTTAQSSKPATSPKPKATASAAAKNPLENESKGPITTEIYADEASFDSGKNMGIFTGHVKVFDPRFNLQSDKLTVYLRKGEDQGLEKAIAEGNVGLVRDRPDPNGGPPTHAVGRSEHAVYMATDGSVELTGMPKVQQGPNMHIATSAQTVMVINQDGHLDTHGPSRTEIRQEPKEEKPGSPAATASPSPKP